MRILIADDHAILRSGLRKIITEKFSDTLFGEAATCAELLENVRGGLWDILILDISMAGQNSLDTLPDVKKIQPGLPVIVLSMYNERQFVVRAFRAGAAAYLAKERAPEELLRAIRAVLDGRRYISESAAEQMADHLALKNPENPHETLSPREYEIFLKIASARSVSEIAADLNLSVKTVSTHRGRIMEKMGMRTNAELMQYAIRRGLTN